MSLVLGKNIGVNFDLLYLLVEGNLMFSPKIVLMGKSAEHTVLGGQEHKCKGHGLYEADGVTLVPTSSLFSTSQHLCWEANCKCSQGWEVPGPLHSGPLSSMSLLTHVKAVL